MTGCLCAAAFAGTPTGASAASLDGVAEFYAGRRVTMISGFTPEGGDRQQEQAFGGMTLTSGLTPRGGEDLHGRLLARHIGRHIPGQPQFIVQTLPGAGGRRAADYLARQAPRDGSVIGNLMRGIAVEPLLATNGSPFDDRARPFDPATLQWLGSLAGDTGFVVAWHAAGTITAESLFEREMLVGGTRARDDSVLLPRALNALIGARFKLIAGYASAVELQIAMERGEIAGFLTGSGEIKNRLVPWVRNGQASAVMQLGLTRDEDFRAAPLALDFARNPEDRAALEFLFARQAFGAPYAAPPEVPANRVAALRQAFDATMTDGDFRADAAKLEIDLRPLSGARLTAMMSALRAAPSSVKARAAAAITGQVDERR